MVDHVQYFAYFVKGFHVDNLWRAWSYPTLLFMPYSFPLLPVGLVSYHEDGARSCRLRTIFLYPSGEVGMQAISSVIPKFHQHLRLSKPYKHHPSTFMPILKTSLMHNPPSCGCSPQCPFQSIERLLFWHLSFKVF